MTKKSGLDLQQRQGGVSYKTAQPSPVDKPTSFCVSIDINLLGVKQLERESDPLLQVLPQIPSCSGA